VHTPFCEGRRLRETFGSATTLHTSPVFRGLQGSVMKLQQKASDAGTKRAMRTNVKCTRLSFSPIQARGHLLTTLTRARPSRRYE